MTIEQRIKEQIKSLNEESKSINKFWGDNARHPIYTAHDVAVLLRDILNGTSEQYKGE